MKLYTAEGYLAEFGTKAPSDFVVTDDNDMVMLNYSDHGDEGAVCVIPVKVPNRISLPKETYENVYAMFNDLFDALTDN